MNDLDESRKKLIEQIKHVFPKKPPETNPLKLVEDYAVLYSAPSLYLNEILEGKLWEEVIELSDPSIIYALSGASGK